MTTKTEVVLEPNGHTTYREIREYACTFPDQILQQFANRTSFIVPNLLRPDLLYPAIPTAIANVITCFSKDRTLWVMELDMVRFRTAITTTPDGYAHPLFTNEPHTAIDLDFYPGRHSDMRVFYAMGILHSKGMAKSEKNYLFAMGPQYTPHRMPTGNVYDDCSVCTGDCLLAGETQLELVRGIMQQFYEGPWNGDLHKQQDKCNGLFRFLPRADSSFSQQNPDSPWPELCQKVAGVAALDEFINLIKLTEESPL